MPCVPISHLNKIRAEHRAKRRARRQSPGHVKSSDATSAENFATGKIDSPSQKPELLSVDLPDAPVLSQSVESTNKRAAKTRKPTLTFRRPSDAFRTLRRPVRPSRADLINAESRLGSKIFGPIPEGHRREFFHDRSNIWIWHEDWTDESVHDHQLTVRYEVRKTGVYKKISAGSYFKLEGDELDNFRKAARAYLKVIKAELYHR